MSAISNLYIDQGSDFSVTVCMTDAPSAALDLSNTGLDIARLQAPTGANKKKGKNRLQRYLKSFYN